MHLAVNPPILPMLAKRVSELPKEGPWIFEPKWDGFRALVFRDGEDELREPGLLGKVRLGRVGYPDFPSLDRQNFGIILHFGTSPRAMGQLFTA